ncbi:MAG: hypothetical protein IJ137_03490 [Eubacterium sp.]|nr:hypothetical protein [Eubacterium sp.]
MSGNDVINPFGLPDYQQIIACQTRQEEESREAEEERMVLPPEDLAREERAYWNDYEYITQLLPMIARECWAAADAVLDRYEYEDSPIYIEYPDKVTLQRIADVIYERMHRYEEQEDREAGDGGRMANPYYISGDKGGKATPLRDVIYIMTAWNMSFRRQRYYRRSKVFK